MAGGMNFLFPRVRKVSLHRAIWFKLTKRNGKQKGCQSPLFGKVEGRKVENFYKNILPL